MVSWWRCMQMYMMYCVLITSSLIGANLEHSRNNWHDDTLHRKTWLHCECIYNVVNHNFCYKISISWPAHLYTATLCWSSKWSSLCKVLCKLLKWVSIFLLNYMILYSMVSNDSLCHPSCRAYECNVPYQDYIWLGHSSRDMLVNLKVATTKRGQCQCCILSPRYDGMAFGLTNTWVWLSSNETMQTKVQILVERIVGKLCC